MIVKDKEKTLTKADEIAVKIIDLIKDEVTTFECEDDPAEFIYLYVHIAGNVVAKICVILYLYSKIYAIPNVDPKSINEWIDATIKEYIPHYEAQADEQS